MNNSCIYDFVTKFNKSELRKRMVPQEVVSGWPCIQKVGKTLCITIPYYSRLLGREKTALYPLFCSVTLPLGNPDRVLDFTIYPYQKEWRDLDYTKPAGYFKHEALADVKTKEEYEALCKELYGYYDKMVEAILNKRPFQEEKEMIVLFSRLMEPGHYPQYLRINKKFYAYFCHL